MFKVPTLFVVGAGAGFDTGMCLGAKLMQEIAKDVNIVFKGGSDLALGDPSIARGIRIYAKRHNIDANQLYAAGRSIATGIGYAGSIDNYIHHHRNNETIKAVGKMAIIKVILEYERKSKVFIDTTKHPRRFRDPGGISQSWLHSFFRLAGSGLVVGETLDTIFDNIAFVTFNYDRCLEQFLWLALQERFMVSADHAARLVKKLDIIHAYGRVAPLSWEADNEAVDLGGSQYGDDLDLVSLSENIRTYNEEVSDRTQIEKIHQKLLWAKNTVFLGFHFHTQNVVLITPPDESRKVAVKHAFATVIERKKPEIEKIERQISSLLRSSSTEPFVHFEEAGCDELFARWGTTLAD